MHKDEKMRINNKEKGKIKRTNKFKTKKMQKSAKNSNLHLTQHKL
jgi:hypothetical protein